MKKIKFVEIQAFRAYKSKVIFDFTHKQTGSVSDLVVIFAPNGYGKTSFYEAIEWLLTGDLRRFNPKESKVQFESADKLRGEILRNNEAVDADLSYIKITSEDFLENERQVTKSRQSKYGQTDLNEGKIIRQEVFKDISIVDNILSQEKIDDFVRSKTSAEKFDVLQDYWQGEEETNNYKVISELIKKFEEKILEYKDSKEQITIELELIKKEYSKTVELNAIIDNINKYNQLQISKPDFENISKDVLDNFEKEIIEDKGIVKETIAEIEKSNNTLIRLKHDFNYFEVNNKTLEETQLAIKNHEKNITSFKRKIFIENNILKLENELTEKLNYLHKLNELENNRIYFLEIHFEIKSKSEIEGISIIKFKEKIEQKIKNFSNLLEEKDKELKRLANKQTELDYNYREYIFAKNEIPKYTQNISNQQETINTHSSTINNANEKIYKYKKLLLVEDYLSTNRSSEYSEFPIFCDVENKFRYNNSLKNKITTIEKDLKIKIEQSKELDRVLELSINHIDKDHLDNCPVCDTHFGYDNLKQTVINRKGNSDIINEIRLEKERLNEELNKNESEFNVQNEQLKQQIQTELNKYNQLLFEHQKAMDIINNDIRQLKHELSERELKVNIISDEIKREYGISDVSIFDVEKEQVNYKIKISVFEKEYSDLLKSIEHETSILKDLIQQVNNIEDLKRNPKYSDFARKLIELKLNVESLIDSDLFLKRIIENSNLQINELKSNLEIVKPEYLDLIAKLESLNEQIEIKELQNKENEIKTLKSQIANYTQIYLSEFSNLEISLKNIEEKYEIQTNRLQYLQDVNSLLYRLSEYLEHIRRFLHKDKIQEKLSKIESSINKASELLLNFQSSKEIIKTHIKERISNSFNEETINQIYKRLDPHPNQKIIGFEPDLEDDKPKIRILSENKKDPLIFNSSGQINSLSLSIFLAKSLNKADSEFGTIFMDDPIQFLDGMNVLAFIDLVRTIITKHKRQIVISTHDENFFKLLQRKMDTDYYKSKFMELVSFGVLKDE